LFIISKKIEKLREELKITKQALDNTTREKLREKEEELQKVLD
jgi:hypothetical protein